MDSDSQCAALEGNLDRVCAELQTTVSVSGQFLCDVKNQFTVDLLAARANCEKKEMDLRAAHDERIFWVWFLKKKLQAHQMRALRAFNSRQQASETTQRKLHNLSVNHRGLYRCPRPHPRPHHHHHHHHHHVRLFHIGTNVQAVSRAVGANIKHRMSSRTVGRCVLEGGVAATVRLGHEIARTDGEQRMSDLLLID